MKKYSVLIFISLLLSCNNFLEEDAKGKLSPDNYFSSEEDLDMAMTAIYDKFQTLNKDPGHALYAYCADDVTSQNAGNKTRFAEYDMFNYNSGNKELTNMYKDFWITVKACNYVINNAERTPVTKDFLNERLGQAYLIRAYCYFMMVRLWGYIPVVTEVEIDYDREKEDPATIYELIESDCLMAEEMLPVMHDADPYYQEGINVAPGKGAAKALLASVYMTEAGWPLNKGESYYDKAAAKFKEIIDNEATYGYTLEPDIMDLTLIEGNYSQEIVWGSFYYIDQEGYSGPKRELPEETGGWCDLIVEIEFFNSMPDGPRKDAWILQYISFPGQTDPEGNTLIVPWYSSETNQQHPHWRKNIDNGSWDYSVDEEGNVTYTKEGITSKSSKTQYIYRYADILLLYAEAKAFGSSGSGDLAYTCINRVRERADLEDISSLSKSDFQQAVLDERRWETAGIEHSCMSRFFTMQRHEILHKQAEYRSEDDLTLNSSLSLSEDFYYFPIPDEEALIVPQMDN
jgi:starch-binding outer membrane protein, SusD/RagB family